MFGYSRTMAVDTVVPIRSIKRTRSGARGVEASRLTHSLGNTSVAVSMGMPCSRFFEGVLSRTVSAGGRSTVGFGFDPRLVSMSREHTSDKKYRPNAG